MKKIITILLFMMVLGMFSAYAAIDCNLTVPNPIGNRSQINASYNASVGSVGYSVAFFASSSSTRNSTALPFANATNTSRRVTTNLTFGNNIILEDSNDYSIYAICYHNSTGAGGAPEFTQSTTTTGVTIDRTDPSAPSAITFLNPVKNGETITATIDRETANRCFIQFGGPNVEKLPMALSGSTCTFTAAPNNPPNSAYDAFLVADDRTNSTTSSMNNIIIQAATNNGGFSGSIEIPGGQSGSIDVNAIFNPADTAKKKQTAVLIIIVLVVLVFINKKK